MMRKEIVTALLLSAALGCISAGCASPSSVSSNDTQHSVETASMNLDLNEDSDIKESSAVEDLSPASESTFIQEDAPIAQDRSVYADGFYYEPLHKAIQQRIYGLSYKEDCTIPYEDLRYVSVLYVDFEGSTQRGELICNKEIAQDLVEIFYELNQAAYPIDKIRLIDEYNADDDLSCLDNNTSCFNYRVISGSTNLSKHAQGLAVDINPFYNPYVTYPDGVEHISPPGSEPYADRSLDFPYKIDENDLCYQLFTAHGFTWGGNWNTLKDYQHFQKELSSKKDSD